MFSFYFRWVSSSSDWRSVHSRIGDNVNRFEMVPSSPGESSRYTAAYVSGNKWHYWNRETSFCTGQNQTEICRGVLHRSTKV